MRICARAAVVVVVLLSSSPAQAQFSVPDPAPAENFTLELGLAFWTPTPELLLQTGALARLGEAEVDLVREFAIEDTRFRDFSVTLKAGRKHKIRFNRLEMKYDEAAVLERSFTFGGQEFPVSIPATALLTWDLWRFGYEWDFVATGRGLLGVIVDLKYNRVDAELAAEGVGATVTEATAPVPTIGFIARVYPHRAFSVTTEFTGFSVPGFIGDRISDSLSEDDDFEAKLYQFDIYGTLNFGRHLGIQGGYRRLSADYLVDDDAGDFKLKGWYWGGLLRF